MQSTTTTASSLWLEGGRSLLRTAPRYSWHTGHRTRARGTIHEEELASFVRCLCSGWSFVCFELDCVMRVLLFSHVRLKVRGGKLDTNPPCPFSGMAGRPAWRTQSPRKQRWGCREAAPTPGVRIPSVRNGVKEAGSTLGTADVIPSGAAIKTDAQSDPESTKPSKMEGRRMSRLVAPCWEPHPLSRSTLPGSAGWHGRRPIS
jgi:hypothetical protein